MKPTFKMTAGLAVLLIALVSFVYFYEIKGGEERQQAEEQANRVLNFEPDSVTMLELEAGDSHVKLIRDSAAADWQLTLPVTAAGNNEAISNMLAAVDSAKKYRTLSGADLNMAEFGLDAPALTLQMTVKPNRHFKLLFGDYSPTTNHVYARIADDSTVVMVPKDVFQAVDKRAFQLRDRHLVHFRPEQVVEIAVNLYDNEYRCRKAGDQWQLIEPFLARANTEEVENLLRKLDQARIDVFVDEQPHDLTPYGLQTPAQSITLSLADQAEPVALLIGDRVDGDENFYAKDSTRPLVYKITSEVVRKTLNIPLTQIENREVLDFFNYQVKTVKVSTPDLEIQLFEQDYLDWRLIEPLQTRADNQRVDSLLANLNDLAYLEIFASEAELPITVDFTSPAYRVELFGDVDDNLLDALFIYPQDGLTFARTAASEFIYELRPEGYAFLNQSLEHWRDRNLVRYKRYDIKKLDITWAGTRFVAERDDVNFWAFSQPQEKQVQRAAVDLLLDLLAEVKIERFIATDDSLALNVDNEIGTIHLETENNLYELTIYQQSDSDWMASADPERYELDAASFQKFVDQLKTLEKQLGD